MKAVDNAKIAELLKEAAASPRRRTHFNLHESTDDPTNRLLVVCQPDTVIAPHRHMTKWELFTILEGKIAAYTYGAEWLQQVRMYIIENMRVVQEYIEAHIPGIKVYPTQASFLMWLDCREMGLSQPELVSLFQDKAGLALNDGSIFGPGGEGHMRLNVGCPRSILLDAMQRLAEAVKQK